jgi:hypothetical protein
MKRTFLILVLVSFTMLTISCDIKTNFPEEGFGKTIVHNEAGSGKTITRITIASGSSNIFNDKVSIPPGGRSNEYELEIILSGSGSLFSRRYNVTITLDDNTTKSKSIDAYEDIVNNLYYGGTDLVER